MSHSLYSLSIVWHLHLTRFRVLSVREECLIQWSWSPLDKLLSDCGVAGTWCREGSRVGPHAARRKCQTTVVVNVIISPFGCIKLFRNVDTDGLLTSNNSVAVNDPLSTIRNYGKKSNLLIKPRWRDCKHHTYPVSL